MGCFLACFGFTKKRKRRKGCSKIISEDHRYVRYVPLDSDAAVKLDSVEQPETSVTKVSDKPKEVKTKKKVSFNLNVKTYEPLPSDDEIDMYLSEGEEKTMWEYKEEERSGIGLHFEEDSIALKTAAYTSNYRYQNWRETYDGDDEINVEDSDVEDDNDDDLEWDEDDDIDSEDYGEPEQNPESKEHERKITADDYDEHRNCNHVQLQASQCQELNGSEINRSARKRSEYFSSVLSPVENLSQWKAVKSKPLKQAKNQKENIPSSEQEQQKQITCMLQKSSQPLTSRTLQTTNCSKPIMHEIAVNASLSNWLI